MKSVKEFYERNPFPEIDIPDSMFMDLYLGKLGIPATAFTGKALLDVGCGSGIKTRFFKRMGAKVTAIDISKVAAKASKGTVMSAANLKYKDGSFDIVHCAGVLHHMADTKEGFRECCRVLKRNGILVVALYNKHNIIYPLCYKIFKHLPKFLVFPIYYLGWKLVGSKMKKQQIWNLMEDQWYTPIAKFFKVKEVAQWFQTEGIRTIALTGTGYFKFFPTHKRAMIYYCGLKK